MSYKVTAEPTPVVLDPDSFCPCVGLNVKIRLPYAAQYDGPSTWPDYVIEMETNELISNIASEVEEIVADWVKKNNPNSFLYKTPPSIPDDNVQDLLRLAGIDP